jgi:hypothetical protein
MAGLLMKELIARGDSTDALSFAPAVSPVGFTRVTRTSTARRTYQP